MCRAAPVAEDHAGHQQPAAPQQLLDQATTLRPTLTKTWVDAGFKVKTVEHGPTLGVDVEIVTKDPQVKGFSVVTRCWVVERTIGWLMHHRRLARDYEPGPPTPRQ